MLDTSIGRRGFIELAGTASVGSFLTASEAAPDVRTVQGDDTRPNLLFLHLDQLGHRAIACHGDPHVHTPNIDRLAAQCVDFSKSYTPDPICCPARASWVTGRYPSEHNIVVNNRPLRSELPDFGGWLGKNGYQTVHIGKWHIGRWLNTSFQLVPHNTHPQGEYGDNITALSFEAFLSQRKDSRPFFANVGLMNPHDCGNTARNALHPFPFRDMVDELPPLPENFNYDTRVPEHLGRMHRGIRNMTADWSDENWRHARWLYYRLVEMVDVNVGYILDTLDRSPYGDNTLVVFTADHGECNAHHQMFFKNNFYEESVRVPLMVRPPGGRRTGRKDKQSLVSGLDIFPTLCDYAGIAPPDIQRGRTLRPLLEDRKADWRRRVFAQSKVAGRMVVDERYKFARYYDSETVQLFDLLHDPEETRNVAYDADHQARRRDLASAIDDLESSLDNVPLPPELTKGFSS